MKYIYYIFFFYMHMKRARRKYARSIARAGPQDQRPKKVI